MFWDLNEAREAICGRVLRLAKGERWILPAWMGGQPVLGEWNHPQLLWASFPPPFHPMEELVSSQGLGTGWPGAGKEGEGAAWHRRAAWVCGACVFQSSTLETLSV